MMAPFIVAQLLVLLPMAWLVGRSQSSRTARHRASYAMAASGAVAILQLLSGSIDLPGFEWSAHWLSESGAHSWVPAFSAITSLMGFTAIALSPISETRPTTFRRILLLIAVALVFLAVRNPIALAALWAASAVIAWLELRDLKRAPAIAKLFAVYQVPSVAAFGLGAILLGLDQRAAGLVCVLIGIGIREAVIPLHSWFPAFVRYAPMGLVVAFFAPQLGVYAHLELLRGELPHQLAHAVAALGAVTAVLAAALSVAQTDARRALAFLVMSQTGLVAFGLDTSSSIAQVGALLTWQVIGVATAGFAMTLASLEARRGPLSLQSPTGSFTRTPRMAVAFLFMGFASVGLPLTLGFVAEDLLVQGSVREFPMLAFALIVATALNGVSVMRAFFMLFSGSAKHIGERDLTSRETAALSVVMSALLVTGLFPAATVRGLEQVTTQEDRVDHGAAAPSAAVSPDARGSESRALTCRLVQSPVNIATTVKPTGRHRVTPYFELERASQGADRGDAVDARWVLGSPISYDGRHYDFHGLHFHRPSTHLLDGIKYPMELHGVYVARPGSSDESLRFLLIGVPFRIGEADPFLDELIELTQEHHGSAMSPETLGDGMLGSRSQRYFHYRGSLATPPYAEDVDVFVLGEPRTVSREQMSRAQASQIEDRALGRTPRDVEYVE